MGARQVAAHPRAPCAAARPGDAITVGRAKQYSALLRKLTILIDGAPVGRIGPGEIRHFAVAPGRHAVTVKIDWCTAAPLQIEKRARENVAIRCGVKANVAAFFRPGDYAYVSMDAGGVAR